LENRLVKPVQANVIQLAKLVEVESGYDEPIQPAFTTSVEKPRSKFGLF
jgi:hypothetical protein